MRINARKTIRLSNYDYSSPDDYFVTICTKDRECWLGNIVHEKNVLNLLGTIVYRQIIWLEQRFPYVEIDEFVVMPNHIHVIIGIRNIDVGAGRDLPNIISIQDRAGRDLPLQCKIKPLSQLVGAFKTTSSKIIHKFGFDNFQWQRNYYERIIRDEYEFMKIRKYIMNNPYNWANDRNYRQIM